MVSNELKAYVDDIKISLKPFQVENRAVDYELIEALFKASQTAMFREDDVEFSMSCSKKAKELLFERIVKETNGNMNLWELENYCAKNKEPVQEIDLFYKILKQESFYDFQAFIYYMEKDREPEKRFYFPRRKTLRVVLDDLMALERGEFKFYGLSMPPRVGKSTICIFFLAWIMLKYPNLHNAMCGHSGVLAKGFFKEIMTFLTSADYTYKELYEFWHPGRVMIRDKSAEDYTVNLDKPDRFPTLTCRGIDATWTGAVDVSGYLYVDDLVRDREESMSMIRMENLYQEYQNKVLDRKSDGAKELMVGTLWSVNDPLERTRLLYENDPRYRFRRIPALDENDRSNFEYEIGGFSAEYYKDLRRRLESAEWQAKYMQKPFVREGLLFERESLRYWDGIIPNDDRECRTIAVIDPAFGGGDSLSMPICRDYGDKERYIIDWVFNTGTQKVTIPKVVAKIIQHYVTLVRIEQNSGGRLLADNIKDALAKENCLHCKIELVSAPVKMSKEDKISGYSDFVKENFIFLFMSKQKDKVTGHRYNMGAEYRKAMEELYMYSPQGRNLHDDAADSLTQLAMAFERKHNGEVSVPINPFKMY